MTEQEKINAELQTNLALQDAKFNIFMQEMRDFKNEMRDRDNQRAAEIMELRQRQDAAQAKHDADMKDMQKNFYAKMDAMDAKIDNIGNHVRNLSITAMGAIGAIVITVIISLIKN